MRVGWKTGLAWTLFGLISLGALIVLIQTLSQPIPELSAVHRIGNALWILFPVGFGFMGALVLTYQPRNIIGWLLMIPALGFTLQNPLDSYLATFSAAPLHPTVLFELFLWFDAWSWWLLILPLLLIVLLFPIGKLLSRRWRWVLFLLFFIFAIYMGLSTFAPDLETTDGSLSVPNPIGLLTESSLNAMLPVFGILFIISIILCIGSIFVRYRRARLVEREQMKWLGYACGLFALFYLPIFGTSLTSDTWNPPDILVMFFPLVVLAFPISIAIAILRYRLWDIDVIIRRTLVYGALTAVLALVYFGAVTLSQNLFVAATGEQSPVAIVLSTLAIAALFTPLRRRIQNIIDRRFYRRKYDAEKTLQDFALRAREETDLDSLTAELLAVVDDTMQPESVTVWLKERPE
jgi:hypothetical protein